MWPATLANPPTPNTTRRADSRHGLKHNPLPRFAARPQTQSSTPIPAPSQNRPAALTCRAAPSTTRHVSSSHASPHGSPRNPPCDRRRCGDHPAPPPHHGAPTTRRSKKPQWSPLLPATQYTRSQTGRPPAHSVPASAASCFPIAQSRHREKQKVAHKAATPNHTEPNSTADATCKSTPAPTPHRTRFWREMSQIATKNEGTTEPSATNRADTFPRIPATWENKTTVDAIGAKPPPHRQQPGELRAKRRLIAAKPGQ